MVNPLVLIAAALAFAFAYPGLQRMRIGRPAAIALLVGFVGVSVAWLWGLLSGSPPMVVHTGGFAAPLSINLSVGLVEAVVLVGVNSVGLLGFCSLFGLRHRVAEPAVREVALFFVLLLGANGLVMTRDLFNVFVFMEIAGIALAGLLSSSSDPRTSEAGFKYMIAGGLSSAFYLIGLGLVYRLTGAVNVDVLVQNPGALHGPLGLIALTLLVAGIMVELKPAFANGWGLDVYQTADGGIGALVSAVSTSAVLIVLVKLSPLLVGAGGLWLPGFATLLLVTGAASLLASNIAALGQRDVKRMLGMSSVGQVGLVLVVLSVARFFGVDGPTAGFDFSLGGLTDAGWLRALVAFAPDARLPAALVAVLPVVVVLVVNHAVAKAVLFWVAAAAGDPAAPQRTRPWLLIAALAAVAALVGLPPFPSFWAKWTLIRMLVAAGRGFEVTIVLVGALAEAVFLLRWFAALARRPDDAMDTVGERVPADFEPSERTLVAETSAAAVAAPAVAAPTGHTGGLAFGFGGSTAIWPAVVAAAVLFVVGLGFAAGWAVDRTFIQLMWITVGVGALLWLVDRTALPSLVSVLVGFGAVALFAWTAYPLLVTATAAGIRQVFAVVFLGGGTIQMVALAARPRRERGLVAPFVVTVLAVTLLTVADNALAFFVAWEWTALAAYLLIARGNRGAAASLRAVVFSIAGAFAVMVGLIMMETITGASAFAGLDPSATDRYASLPLVGAAVLVAVGALIKSGALGVHVWLPAAYAEAPNAASALISSVVSKAGVLLLFLTAGWYARPLIPALAATVFDGFSVAQVLGWVGVATALAGALLAVFQEDVKYTLAYSSMGQVGYMILGFSLMSHLGWVAGLYQTVVHLMFKAMLFLAVAGVVHRTGTRLMYQMGGLIKRMPISFVSVLIAIIALSGVPPLTGFGAKWLLYTALLEKGWYLQAALAMFASAVAFLYLYRLIHSVFLGQLKDEHRNLREAPVLVLIPQILFIVVIMVFSMFPNLIVQPLQAVVEPYFAATVQWEGGTAISALGYWNGSAVMYVTIGVFAAVLVWLLVVIGRVQTVEQFNIVFAAERPERPETTHYAFNFYSHYRKALGFLVRPSVERGWCRARASVHTVATALLRWNTGNAQSYALQVLAFLLVMYALITGGTT